MKFILLITFTIFSFSVSAQSKLLTMEDALVKNRSTLAPQSLRQLQFIKGTNDFAFIKKVNNEDVWVRASAKQHEGTPVLTLKQINERVRGAGLDTFKTLPPVQFNNDNYVLSIKGNRYAFDEKGGFRLLGAKEAAGKSATDESAMGYVAFVDSFNLYVTRDGVTRAVSRDGNDALIYGEAVHQQEFGISKGTFWNNKGNQLAFYRMDQSMVPNYPIVDFKPRPAEVENLRYPMAGEKSHHVTLGVYDAETRKLIYIKTGEPAEQYLTNIAWSPDDKNIFIAIVNRAQNHMKLNVYNASTGDFIKTLFEEQDEKYVEPQHPPLFVKNTPGMFIWQSRRDGYNHLYLFDFSGRMVRQLTRGPWEVTDVKGFNQRGNELFYVSTEASPISRNLYVVNINNGKTRRITEGDVNHNVQVSGDGKFVLDNFSSPNNPRTIQLIEVKNSKKTTLLRADDPLKDFAKGEMSLFTLKANDGSDLYARMFKPAQFDSTKKYPVVVYWYGGPHAQIILNSFNGGSGDYWFQYLAQRGYLVFSLDTRGSANRGMAFEQTIFRRAGTPQMEDLMTGVNYLQTLPYADTKRMGLFGWSYGGFMTTNFMLTHPGVFKAAVAGGPVIDWKFYEIMYTERYMDTPQENPEGYEQTDLTKRVDQLKGKLMLIHGMQDNVVILQHSINFLKAAVDKGVQIDFMLYPGHKHNVLGKDRAHLYQKVTDYFFLHL